LKKAMLSMINQIEQIAIAGAFPNGNKVNIYLSQVDFHFSYAYCSADLSEYCFFKLYSLHYLYTSDPRICNMHNDTINALMKYSTLISHSNEIYRVVYFREQRKMVEDMTINS
ncbi:MAG: hypothetical protein LBS52_02805, partial [Dysgonamonadaceae bacterium]|jgi:hypothetical protein|nr:hypothetical protein [Dysgonamonadaceae bacterium]